MKIIAFEGLDASGKGTQTALLRDKLIEKGNRVLLVSFPNYKSPTGEKILKFLRNELIRTIPLSTFEIAVLFSEDRKAWFKENPVEKLEKEYDYVIFDRYVFSNIINQTVDMNDRQKEIFSKTMYHIEYVKNLLPKPDYEIFLDVSDKVRMENLSKRGRDSKDRYENDLEFLSKARNNVISQIKNNDNIRFRKMDVVVCDDGNTMFNEEVVSKMVVDLLDRQ